MTKIKASNKYSRGSEWRKWDLHVHTPSSLLQGFGGNKDDVWEEYLADLEGLPKEFKVLGVNDYLFLDGYERLKKEKEKNGRLQNIGLLLPVLEWRIEKFAGIEFGRLKRINLHVIFSDELSIETIKSQFLNTLEQGYYLENGKRWNRAITRKSLKELGKKIKSNVPQEELSNYGTDLEEGFNNLNIKESQIFDSLNKDCFKDKYLTAIGKTEWDELKWSDSSIATKKSIINSVNLIFTSAENIEKFNKARKKLKKQGVNDLLLDCSDAHYFSNSEEKDRVGKCFTWIKADPTFEGLKQIIYEPEERLYVGEKDPNNFNYPVLSKFKIKESKNFFFSKGTEIFFNKNLVSVIGSRGAGKSALLDLIALSLGKRTDVLDDRSNYIKSFLDNSGSLKISIGVKRSSSLKEKKYNIEISKGNITEIRPILDAEYFPQREIGKLADPKDSKGKMELSEFIKRRVFKGKASAKLEEFESIKHETVRKLEENRDKIVDLDRNIEKEKKYRYRLEELKTYLNQLDNEKIRDLIEKRAFIVEQQEVKKSFLMDVVAIKKKLDAFIEDLEQSFPSLSAEEKNNSEGVANESYEIDLAKEWLELRNNFYSKKIKNIYKSLKKTQEQVKDLKSEIEKTEILKNSKTISNIVSKIEKIKKDMGIELDESTIFELQREQKKIEQRLEDIKKNKEKKEKLLKKRNEIRDSYLEAMKQLQEELQQEFDNFMKNEGGVLNNSIKIRFRHEEAPMEVLKIVKEYRNPNDWRFPDSGFQQVIKEKGADSIIRCFRKGSFDGWEKIDSLGPASVASFSSIENKEEIALLLEENLPNLQFTIKWCSEDKKEYKPLEECSIGERSTAVLSIILVSGTNPLIIDQPEDDLDHNYLYKPLSKKIIREVKKRRQLIFATHNSNIVINGDSEEVLVLQSKTHQKGSINVTTIENKEKRQYLTMILEGGDEAFKKREKRYDIKLNTHK